MSQKDVGNKVPIYKLKKTEEALRYWKEAARIGPGSDLLEKKILNEEYME